MAFCLTVVFASTTFGKASVLAADETQKILLGEIIKAEDFEILHAGGTVKAESMTIVYPSGGIYGGDSFEVNQAGLYQITYHATIGDKKVSQTQEYMAIRRPQDLIVGEDGMEIGYGKFNVESPYPIKKNVSGVIVNFKSGQSVTFATKIPTSKLTKDYNLFDLIVMPTVFGETDFEKLTVRITDADDENNYVDVIVLSSNAVDGNGQVSYVKAGANGQQAGGYEGSTYHNTNNYGTQVEHSFRGLGRVGEFRDVITISENSLTVAIDNAERRVYCGPVSNSSTANLLVNDLDDVARFKANPWGGFTSDEVTVTITVGNFTKATGVVLFKKLGDFDLSKNVEDTQAPKINVQYDWSQKLPVAVVGKDFPLFPVEIKDNLDENVKSSVWVNYVDSKGNKITVPTDGKTFNAKYEGNYSVVYRAEDYSGNYIEKEVVISAVAKSPKAFMSIGERLIETEVYQTVNLLLAEEVNVFGGSGKLVVDRAVYDPDKNELDVKDNLTLEKLGDYKVVYTVTDYLGSVEYGVVTIRSKATQKPVFVEEPKFESQLIKGFTYELSNPFVIETVGNAIVGLDCKVYVNDSLVEDSFVADGETVTIKYVAEGQTGTAEWEKTISVVDVNYGMYKSKYFYTEDALQISDQKDSIDFTFSADAKTEYVHPLSAKNFSIVFSYKNELINFTQMNLTFVDGKNKNVCVTVKFFFDKDNGILYLEMNGSKEKAVYLTSEDAERGKVMFSFSYLAETGRIVDTSGIEIDTIRVCDNGATFAGFSDEIYTIISFDGVYGQSIMSIDQICNQAMGYIKSSIEKASDNIDPIITIDGEFQVRQKIGSKAKIPTAHAFDVLGQIKVFTVSVEFGGEQIATGPAVQSLDFTLEKAGYYLVTYYAEDTSGNYKEIPYNIIVNDETAPTLKVKGKIKGEYKLGANIKIPKYTVKDNGENCYVQVTLILPNNEMRLLQYYENGKVTSFLSFENTLYESAFKANENTFVVNYKGSYTLRIVAYDEYYNTVVKEFKFTVK